MSADSAPENRDGHGPPESAAAEGRPPTNPVDHVPDSAVSSETTPPDEAGHAEKVSGTGVPGASHSHENLQSGEVGGVEDPLHAMEGQTSGRSLLHRVRRFFSRTGRHGRG